MLPKKVTKILGVDVGTISEGKIILTQKKTYTICVRKLKRGYHKVEYSVFKLNFSKDVARKIAKKWFKEKGQRTLNWMRKNLRVTYWEFPKAIYSYLPKRADKEVTDSIAIYYEGGRFHSYGLE